MIGEAHHRYTTKFQRPLTKAWNELTQKITLELKEHKITNHPAVLDLTKSIEKKE